MAADFGLHPVYKEEFHHVFEEHQDHAEFKPLLVRMKVVDDEGASAMDEDQWEAASMDPVCHHIIGLTDRLYMQIFTLLLHSRKGSLVPYLEYCICFFPLICFLYL